MEKDMSGSMKTYEYVFRYFSNQILSGEMKIHDRIPPEREIAEQLGVSRNSIREVMHMLEINGLIECVQGSGNYVRCNPQDYMTIYAHMIMSLMDIGYEEILYIRIGFELVALRQAIDAATEEELEGIHQALLNMDKAETREDSIFWDQEFHRRLIEASHNRMLILFSLMIRNITNRFISDLRVKILSADELSDELSRSHWGIYDALVHRDYMSGSVAINRHFEIVGNELFS
ncbi:MAG: FadR family transcriptional regulator [Eubacterium sp.]|nr:FadR family transcriptional regulator [Eubacterium sp.]